LTCEVRDQRDLLVGERSNLPAIDGDCADQLILLEHRYGQQCPNAGELDCRAGQWIAIEIGRIGVQVGNVDRLPGLGDSTQAGHRAGPALSAALQLGRYCCRATPVCDGVL